MNSKTRQRSVCPHDCPSVCALDVELLDSSTIGKVYGAKDHSYTQGVICAKVSRYSERVHHPDRLMAPLKRVSSKADTRLGKSTTMRERWVWCSATGLIVSDELSKRLDNIPLFAQRYLMPDSKPVLEKNKVVTPV